MNHHAGQSAIIRHLYLGMFVALVVVLAGLFVDYLRQAVSYGITGECSSLFLNSLFFSPGQLFLVVWAVWAIFALAQAERLSLEQRRLIGAIAIAIAVYFSVIPFNFVLGSYFLIDRILLSCLAFLCILRGVFIPLFLYQLAILLGQYETPLGLSWTDKMLPIYLLACASVVAVLASLRFRVTPRMTALCLAVAIAVCYVRPGIAKILLPGDWVTSNDISNIAFAAHIQNGWLGNLDDGSLMKLLGHISYLRVPLLLATVTAEIGVVCIFIHRRLLYVAFIVLSGMHASIFLLTGILFWKWILCLLLAPSVVRPGVPRRLSQSLRVAPVGLLGVTIGYFCFTHVPLLGWYDSPLAFQFRIEAVDREGITYEVTPAQLSPFDLPLAQGDLWFLSRRPQLVYCLGSTLDLSLLDAIEACQSEEDVEVLRKQYGRVPHDPEACERFEQMMQSYFVACREKQIEHPSVVDLLTPAQAIG